MTICRIAKKFGGGSRAISSPTAGREIRGGRPSFRSRTGASDFNFWLRAECHRIAPRGSTWSASRSALIRKRRMQRLKTGCSSSIRAGSSRSSTQTTSVMNGNTFPTRQARNRSRPSRAPDVYNAAAARSSTRGSITKRELCCPWLTGRDQRSQELHERDHLHRFGQMVIETGLHCSPAIFLLAPSRYGNECHVPLTPLLPDALGDLKAIHF